MTTGRSAGRRGTPPAVRRLLRYVGPVGLAALVVAMVAQAFPLLDVLGYEFATLVAIVVSTAGLAQTILRWGHRPGDSTWRRAWRSGLELTAIVGLMGVVSLANGLRVRNCEPAVGVAYLFVFGLGGVPFVVATAAVACRAVRRRGRRLWLGAGVVGASVISSLAWLALEPSIVVYDPYFGYFAGSIYDESLVAMKGHLVFRAWNAAWAVMLLAAVAFERNRLRRDAAWCVAMIPIVLTIWAFRGDLGLERSRAYVVDALGGYVETEHFEIYYDAESYDPREVELLVSDHEARYAELAEFWAHEPSERLRSFVYGSRTRKGDLMGGYRTLVAKIWLGEMHITWSGVGAELLAHEMAHLFLRDDGTGPLRLASAHGVVPLMALVEGAATAAAWGADELDYHHWSAAIYRLDLGEDIDEILGPAGFWSRYSRRGYTLSGSFTRWLIDTSGPDAFRSAYGGGDFRSAYGRPLAELVGEWRAFLDGLDLTVEQMEAARYRYDRPSLFGRLCARSIATRFDRGEWLAASGRIDDARGCFESIVADDPDNLAYRLRIAERYYALGEPDDAASHARFVRDVDGAGLSQRDRAAELLADLDWWSGDSESALAAYRQLVDRVGTEAGRRRLLAKIQAITGRQERPLTAAAVRRYLVERPAPSAQASNADLLWAAVQEDSVLARYLVGIRLAGDEAATLVPAVLTGLPQGVLDASQMRQARRSLARHYTVIGASADACDAWAAVRDGAVAGSSHAAEAEMWLRRCARGTMPTPSRDPG